MQRREFITLLGGAAAAWPLAARAQQRAMPVVGYITTGAGGESGRSVADFRTGLADAGYVEGKNVMIEFRSAPLGFRRQRELIAELVDRNVSVIVAVGGSTLIQAATSATSVIPIVFVFGGDPLAYGFVEKLNGQAVTSLA
jgi:putative ABC transport system substrate-binding protein